MAIASVVVPLIIVCVPSTVISFIVMLVIRLREIHRPVKLKFVSHREMEGEGSGNWRRVTDESTRTVRDGVGNPFGRLLYL